MSKFLNARIDQIVKSRWQPRESMDPAALEELMTNVRVHGIKSPLKAFVNEEGEKELIAGHRRWQAAIQAGLDRVPLIIVDTPKDEAGLNALHEEVLFDNLLHEPLTPMEEAHAFQSLQKNEGYSIRQMADRLGKGTGYIQARLDLLRFPEDAQGLVYARAYTLRHAREIARVEDPKLREILIEETKAGASCREIMARIDQILAAPEEETCPHGLIPDQCAICQGYELPPDEEWEEEEDEFPTDEEWEEQPEPRLIPVSGNGTTTYISVPPHPAEEPTADEEDSLQRVIQKYTGAEVPAPAPGQHCPHCGDGRGKERCHLCGKERWSINFATFENYQKALTKVGDLVGR